MDKRVAKLSQIYPIIIDDGDTCIDMSETSSIYHIMEAWDLTHQQFADWIFSHFPDGKYCVKHDNGIKVWYWGFDCHRDNLLPALILDNCAEYYIQGERVNADGTPYNPNRWVLFPNEKEITFKELRRLARNACFR